MASTAVSGRSDTAAGKDAAARKDAARRRAATLARLAQSRRKGARAVEPPLMGVLVGGPAAGWKHLDFVLMFWLLQAAGGIAALWWIITRPTGWIEWSAFVLGYLTINLGVSVGFHRYFSHKSFETSRPMRALLAICGQMAGQGSIINWVADHRRHHVFENVPGDPYGPSVDGHGRPTEGFRSFWASHLGWLHDGTHSDWAVWAKGIADDPVILFVHRTRYLWAALSVVVLPGAWGYLWGGPGHVVGTILVGGSLRNLIFSNGVAFTNSLAHSFGYQHFEDKGGARNNWFVALLTLGDGWHNPHHVGPRIASNKIKWWEFDFNGSTIHAMGHVGLAWNVQKRPAGAAAHKLPHMDRLAPAGGDPELVRYGKRKDHPLRDAATAANRRGALFGAGPASEPLVVTSAPVEAKLAGAGSAEVAG